MISLTIPNNVKYIGDHAFSNCTNIQSVTISDGNTPLEFGFSYNGTGTFSGSGIGSLHLGRQISYTGSNSPFGNNTNLTSVIMGSNVTSIGNNCFSSCSGLTSVTLGNGVTSIGSSAFSGCTGLTQIISHPAPPSLQANTFYNVSKTIPVYINCDYLTAYENAQYWSEFKGYFLCYVAVTGVILNKSAITLTVNAWEQLTATVLPANATNQNVNWSSSHSAVASVSSTGKVTALCGGTAIITVTTEDGNKTASCTVSVTLGGNSFISGYVGWENGGKSISQKSVDFPAEDIDVYLQKEQSATWNTVARDITNVEGYFEFRDVPAGKYRVILDIPGIVHNNPQIIVINDRDTIQNIEYVITEDSIINNTLSITTFTKEERTIRVYPNPTQGELRIENYELGIGEYRIFNATGQLMMQGRLYDNDVVGNITTINVTSLPRGIFFLQIAKQTVKFVKQ